MKLQFKTQQYQTAAVDAVVEVFAGQPKHDGISYRIDPGIARPGSTATLYDDSGFFEALTAKNNGAVIYKQVDSFDKLMELVAG